MDLRLKMDGFHGYLTCISCVENGSNFSRQCFGVRTPKTLEFTTGFYEGWINRCRSQERDCLPQITGIQTLVTSRNKKRPFCGSSSEQDQISLDLGHLRPESKDNSWKSLVGGFLGNLNLCFLFNLGVKSLWNHSSHTTYSRTVKSSSSSSSSFHQAKTIPQ